MYGDGQFASGCHRTHLSTKTREIMRITKNLRPDQENIIRFIAVLGGGSVILKTNKRARPEFFISAQVFIHEFIEDGFFRKEEALIKVLQDAGFPEDSGPINGIRTDQKKCHEASELLIQATKAWQAGDEIGRAEVGWAVSEFNSVIRQHLERIKNLIVPLIEQTISGDDEHNVSDEMTKAAAEGGLKDGAEKYVKLIAELEEELSDWK
jgi:hemerythrin-like domain-containing protein